MGNVNRFRGSFYFGADVGPLVMPGKFAVGTTAEIEIGDLIELTGNSNTEWVAMNSDFAGNANVAVAHADLDSGDRAGYYPIEVPRPGDYWEYPLLAAANPSLGAAVFWSAKQVVKDSGSNTLGHVVSHDHYPYPQQHLTRGGIVDLGTTIRNTNHVNIKILPAASYWEALGPLA
jgi:hypothetical protein